MKRGVQLSLNFKLQTTKAVASIILFVISYIVLLILALALTALCFKAGIAIILVKTSFITLGIGIGVILLALFVCFFLIKFLFKSNQTNTDHFVEINESQQPGLFKIINELVDEIGTSPPRKVFVSSDVNAMVFYNSSFWSMFLPIRKNLVIGLGLVNTTSEMELKAILSHEFGHFSQRTMKIGSYVYFVNHIIYNLVHHDEAYESSTRKLTESLGIIGFFVMIAYYLNQGIQLILIQLYFVVNKSYLSLSREMEFHADEIAASVTGYEPLMSSLLRMSLAETAYNFVLNFYQIKFSENIISQNLLAEQSLVIDYLSEYNNIPITDGLPNISLEEQSKYDKSKLTIKDQWASHPSLSDRLARLQKTDFHSKHEKSKRANEIFLNIESLQKETTKRFFYTIDYAHKTREISTDQFNEEYKSIVFSPSFSKAFNGYYDDKNPSHFDIENIQINGNILSVPELFSDQKVELVYSAIALEKDCQTLKIIADNSSFTRTFDYDGKKYKQRDSSQLYNKLKEELQLVQEKIKLHDIEIYKTFYSLATSKGKVEELKNSYLTFHDYSSNYDEKFKIYNDLLNSLQFIEQTTPFEQILTNLKNAKSHEDKLKKEITWLLSEQQISDEITTEMKMKFNKYCSEELSYFDGSSYNNTNIEVLVYCLNQFIFLVNQLFFLKKKTLLDLQNNLLSPSQN